MPDPFLDALNQVRSETQGAADDPFMAAVESVRAGAPAQDSRSWVARTVDRFSTPLLPQIQSGARRFANFLSTPRIGDAELNERVPGAGTLSAALRGGAAGMVEGAGNVLSSFSSPLGLVAWLSGGGAERAGAAGLVNATRALRGVEAATGAAFAERGLERAADAQSAPEVALGLAEAAGGALGARGGLRGALRPVAAPPPVVRGVLRPAPGFVAPEYGPAAPFGTEIPMERAPDGSFVRSVPAEYARHEVRGTLPPGPDFIGAESGPVMTLEQAVASDPFVAALADVRERASTGGRPPAAEASSVRSVPAAIADREFERAKVTRTIYSGDPNAVDAPKVQLSDAEASELRRMAAELETLPFVKKSFNYDVAGQGGTPEVVGGAAGAPVYSDIIRPLSYRPTRGQVLASIRDFLAGRHNALGQEALEVARLRLADDRSVSAPSLPPEAGDLSVRDFAGALAEEGDKHIADVPFALSSEPSQRRAAQGSLLGSGLPPETAASTKGARFTEGQEGAQQLEALLDAIHGEDRPTIGNGTYDPEFDRFAAAVDAVKRPEVAPPGREPGEEGFARPELLARMGLGVAGGAYGYATGDDEADRLRRAALFGAAGLAAPSLLAEGPMRGVIRAAGGGVTQAESARGPIPRAGEIPADRVHTMPALTPEVQQAADALLERYGGFQAQRRGVQSVARTEALADRVEVPTDRPLAPGTALNAERLRAYQNATATILQKQQQLAQRVRDGAATPAERLELEQTQTEAQVLTSSFRGAAAEAGRALHILRYQARILASGDPEAIREAATASARGLTAQARSYFYANILSGVGTHERNILGNVGNAAFNLAAHPFAVAADVARSAATGQARTVFLGELPERVAGTVAALPRAFSNVLHTLRTGIPNADVQTFDRPIHPEFRGGGANPFNWPGRALEAADDFFSTVAAQQTLYGAAFAQAKREGLQGARLLDRVAHLKAYPSEPVLQEVAAQRARLLFREKPGAIADAVLAAKRHLPALDYVVPFVRVPANIIRQGFEASPVGFAMKAARAGERAGADAMGRAALGSIVLAPLAYWAAAGKVTGDAPSDPAERAAFYESGKRPNSILIGNTWYSYQPIQPLNVPLALIANGFQAWRDAKGDKTHTADQIAIDILGRTTGSLLDQSFLSGLSALVDALSDPDRYGRTFVQQLAGGMVPFSGFLRTITQATDPYVRAPKSIGEGVQAIIPGQSETLLPRLTRFGEPVRRDSALNVFKPSAAVADPVADALAAAGVNLRPAAGPKDVGVARDLRVPLTRGEQFNVGQASGRTVRDALERLIASPGFQRAVPAEQQRLLENAVTQGRAAVHQQLRTEIMRRLSGASPR